MVGTSPAPSDAVVDQHMLRAKAMPKHILLGTACAFRRFCLRPHDESPIMGTTFAPCTHKWVLVLPVDHTSSHHAHKRWLWPAQARYRPSIRPIACLEIRKSS